MSQSAAPGESALTPEVKGIIGVTAEKIEASLPWGIEREGLRIFTQAIMDPGEVRRFAEELKRFNIEIQNRMALLQARFAALGDTWQDQEHQKFSEEFRDTMKALFQNAESDRKALHDAVTDLRKEMHGIHVDLIEKIAGR